MLENNLAHIRERISQAAIKAGRQAQEIKLVAVSKGQSVDSMRALAQAGQIVFGESYLQEAQHKIEQMTDLSIVWHFIGRLQSNKANRASALFATIESVHKKELADRLNQQAALLDKNIEILIQVSLAGEAAKSGCSPEQLEPLAQHVATLPHLRLRGLMTMPPFDDDAEKSRPYFVRLRELANKLAPNLPTGSMNELSMGMSDDYPIAIEEGATLVRVGTALFGARQY